MTDYVCVCYALPELKVLSKNARWQNVLFYKCCNQQVAFRNTSNMCDEN
jgi:hypothetical protein